MPDRRNAKTPIVAAANDQPTTPHLRRSPRFVRPKPQDSDTQNPKPSSSYKHGQKQASKKRTGWNEVFIVCALPASGWRKDTSFRNRALSVSSRRRSPRLHPPEIENKPKKGGNGYSKEVKDSAVKNCTDEEPAKNLVGWVSGKSKGKAGVLVDQGEGEVGCVGVEVVREDNLGENGDGVSKKRKRGEEGGNRRAGGWTREQELALQRAYFAAKPTPNFWKKVSKLVPGKSAQDCFDKVHSDHITPPQPQPRSRAKKVKSSPVQSFSLSASKLLNSLEPKINKKKSHLALKTVRQLLHKNNRVPQDYETDLFSVLEPNMNPSAQNSELDIALSTPPISQLQKFHSRSSGQKKPLSRFGCTSGVDLVSPLVLKQIKNRALHEKYIDRLHSREFKRKAEYGRAKKSARGKENSSHINVQKMDVKAAKSALVSEVRDAIDQLQHLQATAPDNYSDDDSLHSGDDEGENEL